MGDCAESGREVRYIGTIPQVIELEGNIKSCPHICIKDMRDTDSKVQGFKYELYLDENAREAIEHKNIRKLYDYPCVYVRIEYDYRVKSGQVSIRHDSVAKICAKYHKIALILSVMDICPSNHRGEVSHVY